jgi:hydrogenase small subunit
MEIETVRKEETIYQHLISRGVTRREFLQFCTWMGGCIGLQASGVAAMVKALETKKRIPVIWLHFQECTCCSESFLRSSHPIVADILLDKISLDYTETLMAASGQQAEKSLHDTMEKYKGEYLLCIEGSVPMGEDGAYCCIGGKTAKSIAEEVAEHAMAVIAWGNCACSGCVQAAKPNPTEAMPIKKIIAGKPIVNVQGCPPIAEVMAGVLVHLLTFGVIPQLDNLGRPKAFYARRVHDTCYRRPNYDAGLFVESFDDENARKGYCLYKVGCKGPTTYNSCGTIRWNGGVSFPIQAGHPCIGCSEANFWDNGPFYQRLPNFPGFGIEATADTIGAVAAGAVVVGAAAHAVLTNVRKRKHIGEQAGEDAEQAEHNHAAQQNSNPSQKS